MTRDEYLESLKREGFPNPIVVEQPAGGALPEHSHPFAARALILEGEITLVIDGVSTAHHPGDSFYLPACTLHSESYGPTGVRYLSSRKATD